MEDHERRGPVQSVPEWLAEARELDAASRVAWTAWADDLLGPLP